MQVHPHLHGIEANKLLGKRHNIILLQVPKIEDNVKNGISKRIHSYTVQFICMEGQDDNSSSKERIIQVNHGHKYQTHNIHRTIQVSK